MEAIRIQMRTNTAGGKAFDDFSSQLATLSGTEIIDEVSREPFIENEMTAFHLMMLEFGKKATVEDVRELISAYTASEVDSTRRIQLGRLASFVQSDEARNELITLVQTQLIVDSGNPESILRGTSEAITRFGSSAEIDQLLRLAAASPEMASRSIDPGLAFLGPDAVNRVLPLIAEIIEGRHELSEDPETLRRVVGMTGNIPSEYSRDALLGMRDDSDAEFARWIQEALENLRRNSPGLFSSIDQ